MDDTAPAGETDLSPLFRPRSVAVVGASRDPGAIGHLVVRNLVEFGYVGPVYPVNPRARSVRGIRCAERIDDLPEQVDLAVLVVPAAAIVEAVEACGRKGVRAAVVISAGFKESGAEGAAREAAMCEVARRHGIRLVGPNCMGVIDTAPEVRLDASFAATFPREGNVAFASQSGALGEVLLARARELGLGLAAFVSLGNKADVDACDLLAHWERDPRVRVILLYVEGLDTPRRFATLARRITRAGKPILMVKSGRSEAGARATSSHTGALAGLDAAMSTFLDQAGVLRVTRVEGLFNLARAFAHQPVPLGPRVAIVSNAGGPGIMAADAATHYGLRMATLRPETEARLRAVLPPAASTTNPVDAIATAGPEAFGACVAALLDDPEVDALLPIFVGPANTDVGAVAREMAARVAAQAAPRKPVLASFMGGRAAEAIDALEAAGIPGYDFPEDAAQAMGALARYRAWLDRTAERAAESSPAPPDLGPAPASLLADAPAGWLPAEDAFALLDAAGIPTVRRAFVRDPAAAAEAAAGLGWPVVLKWDHPDLLHKTELAAVRLGLTTPDAVEAAARDVAARGAASGLEPARGRFLVQAQLAGGRELILGARRDPALGPVVLCGLGGVLTEVLGDVALRVPPLGRADAEAMLEALRGRALLEGHRGAPGVDRAALVDAILRLAALVEACPRIAELDINPLIATQDDVRAVDARVRLE